jgi:hypothetical protein
MAQTVLFVIFVVEFALALVVLLSWKSEYGLSSFEERHPPSTGRCRMLQLARHRRIKRRRQRKRCRQESHRQEG